MKLFLLSLATALLVVCQLQAENWTIDSAEHWTTNIQSAQGATVEDGSVSPSAEVATITTRLHSSDTKRSAKSLVLTQSCLLYTSDAADE